MIDYDEVLKKAKECAPQIIVAGASAYPRFIDWKKFLRLKKEYFPDVTVLIETTPLEKQRKSLEFMDDFGFFA